MAARAPHVRPRYVIAALSVWGDNDQTLSALPVLAMLVGGLSRLAASAFGQVRPLGEGSPGIAPQLAC